MCAGRLGYWSASSDSCQERRMLRSGVDWQAKGLVAEKPEVG